MEQTRNIRNLFKIVTVVVTILLIMFIIYGLKLGIFYDKMIIVSYIKKFGILAPIFFLIFQAFQVVLPIIPGGASCLAGVLAFGPILGFVYNYIGLILGSVMAFYLSRIYGVELIYKLFHEDTIDKYLMYVRSSRFSVIFFLTILIPGFPDDLLCYVAGISNMKFKMFLTLVLIGKPLSLLMYSFFIELF